MKTPFTYCSRIVALVVLFALALVGCGSQTTTGSSSGPITVNLGYFPNLTHAVALVGVERGTFQNALGPNVKLVTKTFNAGPALIEALFAGDIDIGYVGPSPAINGYVKSHGQAKMSRCATFSNRMASRRSTKVGMYRLSRPITPTF